LATLGPAGAKAIEVSVASLTVSDAEPELPERYAVMVAVPKLRPVASPCVPAAFETVATAVELDDHVTRLVMSSVEPSLYVPVAANCCVAFLEIETIAGVTEIETSTALVTVSAEESVWPSKAAETLVAPVETMVTRPWEPTALDTAATRESDVVHVARVVTSCVEPSEYVPTAVKFRVVPMGAAGSTGSTAIEVKVAAVTASWVEPVTPPSEAEIVVDPTPTPLARPCEPAASETVATDRLELDQETWAVKSCVLESLNTPVAANCCRVPRAIEGSVGATWIETSAAAVTEMSVEPVIPPSEADTVAVPTPTPLARPCEPAALEIVATDVLELDQETCAVRSCVLVSV